MNQAMDAMLEVLVPMILVIAVSVSLMLLRTFRFELEDWLEDVLHGRNRFVNFVTRQIARHGQFLKTFDKAVIGPVSLVGFALTLVLHHWSSAVFLGFQSWWFWGRYSSERRATAEARYLQKIEKQLQQDGGS